MTVSTAARRSRHAPPAATVAGAASLGVRVPLGGPRRPGRTIAVFPSAVYVEVAPPQETAQAVRPAGPGGRLAGRELEDRREKAGNNTVVALVASDAVRLPNSVVLAAPARQEPFRGVREGDAAYVGDGYVELSGWLRTQVRRWWDPTPVLGPLSLARLARGARALEAMTGRWGLSGHSAPASLARACICGDLARAVDAAEHIVGLGPGLTPSGDDALAGLLLALRLLGGAVPGGGRAVWLADWLGAAVTAHAGERTTSLAATLLNCAARGQASVETATVLRAIAGQEALAPAARRLLATGYTSGADVTWGLLTGCRSALALSTSGITR